jgi:hypothetical protein
MILLHCPDGRFILRVAQANMQPRKSHAFSFVQKVPSELRLRNARGCACATTTNWRLVVVSKSNGDDEATFRALDSCLGLDKQSL